MAIPFGRMKHVKRTEGKCIATKAAYNGKLRLQFEGNPIIPAQTFDWSKSPAPMSHSIILPKHVDERFKDPEALWNSAEQAEKRRDAQVGKEIVIALPDDKVITDKQRIEMAEKFAEQHFISKGYGVQLDVHYPKKYVDQKTQDFDEELDVIERNNHAHILVTERPFEKNGMSFSRKKVNDLSPQVRGQMHATFDGIEWGKLWTQFQNEYFEKNGLDLRVDSPGLVSQIHLGPLRMRTKRAYEILGEHEKRAELAQLLALDPKIILQKLTENQSVFQETDVEVFLQKYVSDQDREEVSTSFWKSPGLIQLFDKKSGHATTKFTFVDVYEEERKILRLSDKLFQRQISFQSVYDQPSNLNSEQRQAFEKVINGKHLSCIEGLAGTGKSYLLVALKNHYESNGYRVRAFGPDNATVKVLEEKGFKGATSVHHILFKNYFSKKNAILSGKEIWIVDEASKLGNKPLLELLKLSEANNIRLIFSGNSAQLSSVDRGGLFSVFCERYGHAFLGEVQRQANPIHREISKRLAFGDVNAAINMISNTGGFVWRNTKEEAILSLMGKWAEERVNFPYDSSSIIAYTNQEVRQLNDLAHTIRMARGEIFDKEFECQTSGGKIRVSEGDLIEFRENSNKLNVKNGDKGVLIKASEKMFVVNLGGKEISFNPQKFSGFQLGYAVTYFRSQGNTVDRTYILYSRLMCQKLLYVGRTRHIKEAHCFVAYTDAKCLMDLKRQMMKKKEQDNTLNYITLEEIEKNNRIEKREKKIQELCISDSFLFQTKGYSSKIFDFVKSGFGQFIEKIQDRQLDKKFYNIPKNKQFEGRVVVVKEESIPSGKILEATQKNNQSISQRQEKLLSPRMDSYQKLPQEAKGLYRKYFDKIGVSGSLHTIVQSEATALSLQKMYVPSFSAWQKACVERNEVANELLKKGVNLKGVLGEKGYEILRDRAETYNKVLQPKDSIQPELLNNLEGLLHRLFPEGPVRQDSRGFRFGSKGSLAITCVGEKKGCFFNFETREKGNLLTLIEKQFGLNSKEAASWARSFLNESGSKQVPSHFSTERFSKAREDKWLSLLPPQTVKVPQLGSLSRYIESKYRLVAIHTYCNGEGQIACYHLRLEDKETGKKMFLPLSYGKSHPEESPSWRLKGYSQRSELLYNAPLLKQYPDKPVLVVEGEKTADTAYKMLGKDYVVVSWQGGAAAAKEANWKLLSGRNVVIWPDNDVPGFKAASDIGDSLRRVGVQSLKIVGNQALKDLPTKWDLADSLPDGKPSNFVENTILRAENKAIGIGSLAFLASQYDVPLNQLNEIVADIDKRLRPELEEKNGSKTWEIEKVILSETSKYLQEKFKVSLQTSMPHDKEIQSLVKSQTLDLTPCSGLLDP